MRHIAVLALYLSLTLLPLETAAADCGAPAGMADGWPVSSPSEQGLDPALICEIGPRLRDLPKADPNGVVIVRHGALVYERYFDGADQRWPEHRWGEPLPMQTHSAETLHDIQSSTKSVVALLVGIALEGGALKSLNAPVLDFFPEYGDLRTAARDRISVQDLLTMRAGLRWIYRPYLSFWRQIDAAPDPYRMILEQPVTATPGTVFRYNNGSPELIGAILQRATHRSLDAFAKEVLFAKLGITDWEWGRMANGDPGASWGLRLRPRDFAKLGQLVLGHGRWRGEQIISEAWIKAMTAPQVTRRDGAYGYYWWIEKLMLDEHQIDLIEALGWGGQNLYVVPSLDLIIATTAGAYDYDGSGPQDLAAETARDMALRAALGG
jgi:CubicO group peptidase (beta-lactamase class C family)